MLIAAIDLGGTRCKAALIDVPEGPEAIPSVIRRLEPVDVAAASGDEAMDIVAQLVAQLPEAEAVGLAVPGLHGDGLVVALPGKFPGLEGWNVRTRLGNATGLPVLSANDAIAAAAGEAAAGAARGASTAVVITIGTGVGTCVLHDGSPVGRGPHAGGILGGQIPISAAEGPKDTSERQGTIEARCRAERILVEARAAGCKAQTVAEVIDLALAGDVPARAGIASWQRWFLRALVALGHAHGADVLVVGGGPVRDGDPLLTGLADQLPNHTWPGYAPQLRPASLGDDAGLVGMAALTARHEFAAPDAAVSTQAPLVADGPMHRRDRAANYDRRPVVQVPEAGELAQGWDRIITSLQSAIEAHPLGARVVTVDSYPGVLDQDLAAVGRALGRRIIITSSLMKDPATVDAMVANDVTDDPIFGRLTTRDLADFFDQDLLATARASAAKDEPILILGVGASLVASPDLLVFASLPRWELQQRQRAGRIGNLAADNAGLRPSLIYKRAYFVDWRVGDRHKQSLVTEVDFLLDLTDAETPKMITGRDWRRGLYETAHQPFRVVPFFDPGPWGGQWMREVCDLPEGPPNYAWCFDCVPEENSLLLAVGDGDVEVPSIDVVFCHPQALLGPNVAERFGAEFPIRFDFLDTIEGGNLSLQVHPLTKYIREHFGVEYTQDESYYILDAEPEATVYLGLRTDVDRQAMEDDLRLAQSDPDRPFPAEAHVNRFPAQTHDHFLIPAGTVHCSGSGAMVLEISATPYIFTFKLWDWGRLGLDGRPRPINIDRGIANIQWQRDTAYAQEKLINAITPLGEGDGWRAERTGLHEAEFIDTHRHWFTDVVQHDTNNTVNVLNLVQGEEAIIESPTDAFTPFIVHYAETFIVPASVGPYTIRPHGPAVGTECATIKAFVRD